MAHERPQIVIIDDDPTLRKMMRRVLARRCDVVLFDSARGAADWLGAGERPDLILCDLMLPGMTGVDFYAFLETHAPELTSRVVFITAGAYTVRAQAFLSRPSTYHIEKPFQSAEALRAAVREHLRRLAEPIE
jgi:two-component system, NtrC family, sensor kinase